MFRARTRRRLIAILAIATLAVSVGAVGADEGVLDSAGERTIQASQEQGVATIVIDDDTRSTFYPAFGFRPRDTRNGEMITADTLGGCVSMNNSTLLTTDVNLPDGAIVDEITMYGNDPVAAAATLFLSSFDASGFPGSNPALSDIFAASTVGESGNQIVSDTTPSQSGLEVIDTSARNYVLQLRLSDPAIEFCGARITWRIPDPGLVLHPLDACELYNTTPGRGGLDAPLGPGDKHRFLILRGRYSPLGGDDSNCGIPRDADALLVSINILSATADGAIRVWPKGEPALRDDTMIFSANGRTSSAVPVVVGAGDRIVLKNQSAGETNVQLVVLGWYGPPKN